MCTLSWSFEPPKKFWNRPTSDRLEGIPELEFFSGEVRDPTVKILFWQTFAPGRFLRAGLQTSKTAFAGSAEGCRNIAVPWPRWGLNDKDIHERQPATERGLPKLVVGAAQPGHSEAKGLSCFNDQDASLPPWQQQQLAAVRCVLCVCGTRAPSGLVRVSYTFDTLQLLCLHPKMSHRLCMFKRGFDHRTRSFEITN